MKPMNMYALIAGTVFAFAAQTASAGIITYSTTLSGAAEEPSNASPGTGSVTLGYDSSLQALQVDASFSGLIGNVTVAHIHCCTVTAGVGNIGVASPTPTFPGFPAGVTSGVYSYLLDLTSSASFNAPFVANNGGSAASAATALLAGLDEGKAYFNIHTNVFPGGEIRGFLQKQAAIPEPSALLLFGLGLVFMGYQSRRARVNRVPLHQQPAEKRRPGRSCKAKSAKNAVYVE